MPLIECSECGKQISSYAKSCPNCGYSYEREKSFLKGKHDGEHNQYYPPLNQFLGSDYNEGYNIGKEVWSEKRRLQMEAAKKNSGINPDDKAVLLGGGIGCFIGLVIMVSIVLGYGFFHQNDELAGLVLIFSVFPIAGIIIGYRTYKNKNE